MSAGIIKGVLLVVLAGFLVFLRLSAVFGQRTVLNKSETKTSPSGSARQITAIEIAVSPSGYKPEMVEVTKGGRVMLSVKSMGTRNDFNIDEFSIRIPPVKAGDMAIVQFDADKEGEFSFYSTGAKKSGRTGRLVVK